MQQIEVDFDVYKALTLLRESENHSYNDVLREVLGLQAVKDGGPTSPATGNRQEGRSLGGRYLPNGSRLRATHKQQHYSACITEGKLVDQDGRAFHSASAAARAITDTNVNGLTFWQVKRPTDTLWRKLSALPKAAE